MTRLAVIVAVDTYLDQADNLPACEKDGAALHETLKHTARFDEILYLTGRAATESANVKSQLSSLANRHRGTDIDEFVFYFTGHGEFYGGEFRYLLADFNSNMRSQTSLENAELDGIVKALSPGLFVKIVDARQSGVSYIKNTEALEEHIKSTQGSFKNIYFMFSSHSNEDSYASKYLSYFTRSIVGAIVRATPGTVRYRDLMSAASDELGARSVQTPFFVVQATNTEVFCEATPALAAQLAPFLEENPAMREPTSGKSLSLIERIEQTEAAYCTREEAFSAMDRFLRKVQAFVLPDPLNTLYSVSVESHEGSVSGGQEIGEWLARNAERKFFAKPVREIQPYKKRVLKNQSWGALAAAITALGQEADQFTYVDATREVITEYKITTDCPYNRITIKLDPMKKALQPEVCYIVAIISRTHMRLFWATRRFEYTDWDTTAPLPLSAWSSEEFPLKDDEHLSDTAHVILSSFAQIVRSYLLEIWPETPASTAQEDGKSPRANDGRS